MLADEPLQKVLEVHVEIAFHRLQLVADRIQRLGDDGVEHHLVHGAILRGARGAELELVPRERERRRAVVVRGVGRKRRQRIHADLQLRAAARALLRLPGLDLPHHGRKLVAEEDRDDGGRRLVRAETVVVARARRGGAEHVRMEIDRADDGGEDREEDGVLLRVPPRFEEVAVAVGE